MDAELHDTSSLSRRQKRRRSRLSYVTKHRSTANNRERSRMGDIRVAFQKLRKHIPGKFAPTYKHLPKIQVLRFAVSYISELSEILQNDKDQEISVTDQSARLEICLEHGASKNENDIGEPGVQATSEAEAALEEGRNESEVSSRSFVNEASTGLDDYINICGILTPESGALRCFSG